MTINQQDLSRRVMTILFFHQSAELYGSDRVLLYLVEALKKGGNFEPVVLLPTSGPLMDALIDIGIRVHVCCIAKISRASFSFSGLVALSRNLYRSIREINSLFRNEKIDLVHSNTVAVASGAIWAKLNGVSHIWHVHEIILSPKIVSYFFPWFVSFFSRAVISNSKATEQWLLSVKPSLRARSFVCQNGLPQTPQPTDQQISGFLSNINCSEGDIIITLAGRINRWKGHQLLIDAALILSKIGKLKGVHFLFVGSASPGLEHIPLELKSRINSLGISINFSFIDFVEDVWPVWFASDIAVVPSIEPEPFGMVAIEAMAAGLPVIAANHGGITEIIDHDKSGLLFTPRNASDLADKIERLVRDKSLRDSMGRIGKLRQQQLFSIESQKSCIESVYFHSQKL